MRGYPILVDGMGGRLADLDRRIARLEQPHRLHYAERFGWIARSSFTSQPQITSTTQSIEKYVGRIGGPSALWVVEWNSGDNILWDIRYFQFSPTPATSSVVLGSGTITAGSSPAVILLDTAVAEIEGTFGLLVLQARADDVFPYGLSGYSLLDSGFITPEYEIVTS